jgi:hypothetical protein
LERIIGEPETLRAALSSALDSVRNPGAVFPVFQVVDGVIVVPDFVRVCSWLVGDWGGGFIRSTMRDTLRIRDFTQLMGRICLCHVIPFSQRRKGAVERVAGSELRDAKAHKVLHCEGIHASASDAVLLLLRDAWNIHCTSVVPEQHLSLSDVWFPRSLKCVKDDPWALVTE